MLMLIATPQLSLAFPVLVATSAVITPDWPHDHTRSSSYSNK